MITLLGERVTTVTAEPLSTPEPPHPVYAMTLAELEQYRAELERSLSADAMPEYAPARVVLAAQLAEVIAEQAKPGRVRRRAGLDQ